MKEIVIFVGAVGSFISIFFILYKIDTITRDYCATRLTQRGLDSIFDKLGSAKSKFDNSPEEIAALANETMCYIRHDGLEKVLAKYNFLSKILFFILYRHYERIPL
jgi:hypothetical protein